MLYRLIKRRMVAELDAPSDLIARQYAQADRGVERVETESGRVVYRRIKQAWDEPKRPLPEGYMKSFSKGEDDG